MAVAFVDNAGRDYHPATPPDVGVRGLPISAAMIGAADRTVAVNSQAGAYTLALTDDGKAVQTTSASAVAVTIPPNSTVPFAIGALVEVAQMAAGQITITPGAAVTVRSRNTLLKTAGLYAGVSLRKIATDEWLVVGDLVA